MWGERVEDLSGLAFASDFDGTLLVGDNPMTRRTMRADVDAVQAFQARGGRFGICTGRAYHMLLLQLDKRMRPDFYVLASGAEIRDAQGQVLLRHDIPRDVACDIANRWRDKTMRPLSISAEGYYWSMAQLGLKWLRLVSRYEDVPGQMQGLSLVFSSRNQASKARADLMTDYAGVVEASQNEACVDITVAGCTKGTAVVEAKGLLAARAIGCIGDSFNDLPMIEVADRGYTFNRADDAVRERADATVDTVEQALQDFGAWAAV